MDDYIIYEYRDKNGKDLRRKIGKSTLISTEGVHPLEEFTYYDLSRKHIATVYMIINDSDDYKAIKDFYNFHTLENLQTVKAEFIKNYNDKAKIQRTIDVENRKYIGRSDIESSDFRITENDIGGVIQIGEYNPTPKIPIFRHNKTIKIHKDFRNSETLELFNNIDTTNIIFQDDTGNNGIINTLNGYIEYGIKIEDIERRKLDIQEAVGKIRNLEILNLKAEFTIQNFSIDRRIYSMMLVNRGFYGDRLFVNEDVNVTSAKKKFQMKYYMNTLEFSKPILITLTNEESNLIVKVAKVSADTLLPEIKLFTLNTISDYISDKAKIVKLYTKYYKGLSFKESDIVKKKVVQKATKTKQRLNLLKAANPELFENPSYSRLCPGAQQPLVATSTQIAKLDKNKLLEYPKGSGQYYSCDHNKIAKTGETKPRLWPGLKEDTISKTEQKYKYVPCCYPIDQYSKKSTVLYKYLNGEVETITKKGGILDRQKKLPPNRRGMIPSALAEIFKYHGLNSDDLLRYGLPISKSSIIDAIALIKYPNKENRRERVVKQLMESSALYACSQTYTVKYLIHALANDETILAENFYSAMEYYLNATVIVIEKDEFAIPKTRIGFTPNTWTSNKLVIIYKHKDIDQIELIGTYDNNYSTYADNNTISKFVNTRKTVFGFMSSIGYKYPRFFSLVSRATRQYIDIYGKCRGLVVDGCTVFIPPIAPIDKPHTKKLYTNDIELELLYSDGQFAYGKYYMIPSTETLSPLPEDYIKPYIYNSTDFLYTSYETEIESYRLMNREIEPESTIDALDVFLASGVKPPQIRDSINTNNDVIVLNNSYDIHRYINILHTYGQFKWENLKDLQYKVGSIHYLYYKGDKYIVKDVESLSKIDNEYGTLNVLLESRKDGPGIVEYPQGKYGILQKL